MHHLIELIVTMIDEQSWRNVQKGEPNNEQSLLVAFSECFQEEIKAWGEDK